MIDGKQVQGQAEQKSKCSAAMQQNQLMCAQVSDQQWTDPNNFHRALESALYLQLDDRGKLQDNVHVDWTDKLSDDLHGPSHLRPDLDIR